ncbi:hypothetical protein EV192_1286 [Actinocrispum wychmicini]|uniref:Uncharacterized protein n=1 Tax=Actinocrispum wychmicini TaxID=1213861 RepID=A0A4R2IGA1_9PSEU|nr:hypothetical protein EV192_1286 [Actinocrispum wychmicini]
MADAKLYVARGSGFWNGYPCIRCDLGGGTDGAAPVVINAGACSVCLTWCSRKTCTQCSQIVERMPDPTG